MHIQVLIGDEPEQGMENLMEVEIPEDVEEKLTEADIREQQELEKEQEEEKEKIRQKEEEQEEEKNIDAEGTNKEQDAGLIR